MTNKKNKEIKITGESYTHYPGRKSDELTVITNDGKKITVTEHDLPSTGVHQAAEESKDSIRARLRMEAELKLSEEQNKE